MKTKTFKIICIMMVTAVLCSVCIAVFANDGDNNLKRRNNFSTMSFKQRGLRVIHQRAEKCNFFDYTSLSRALDSLVEKESLSREKADAVLKYLNEQKEAFKEQVKKQMEEFKQMTPEGLSGLVEEKTLSKEQADAIIARLKKDKISLMVEDGIITSQQADNIKAWLKKSPLAHMVENGTITQEQLNAVKKRLPVKRHIFRKRFLQGRRNLKNK